MNRQNKLDLKTAVSGKIQNGKSDYKTDEEEKSDTKKEKRGKR